MSIKVACYDVIVDAPLTLSRGGGGDIDSDELAVNVRSICAEDRPVISFVLWAQNPQGLKFKITIKNASGKWEDTWTVDSVARHVMQEVIPAGVLTDTGNKLKVEITEGTGKLFLSDIVLMFMKLHG